MTRGELLARLAGLRQARVGQVRVPHKPLLLLWLFGQFAATGRSEASYQQAEEPVSQLINDFGPPVASAAAARQRAAMPFVHLERELWDLRDATGKEIAPDAPERRAWLLDRGAVGRLRPPVERLLADPATLAAAARLMLDLHFTPVLAELICAAVDLDVPALDLAGSERISSTVQLRPVAAGSPRRSCMRTPISARCAGSTARSGIIPSRSRRLTCAGTASRAPTRWRTRWPSARLHHALFDLGVLGVLGITEDRRIRPVRRQERSWPGSGCARGQATPDPAPTPADSRRRLHLLAPPAGLQGSSQNIDPGPLMPNRVRSPCASISLHETFSWFSCRN